MLTNDVVSFEQPGPGIIYLLITFIYLSFNLFLLLYCLSKKREALFHWKSSMHFFTKKNNFIFMLLEHLTNL